jgi:predicted dienelactone hydrolase
MSAMARITNCAASLQRRKIRSMKAFYNGREGDAPESRECLVLTRLLFTPLLVAALFAAMAMNAAQQDVATVKQLPHPTGRYAIGRIAYQWVDHSRIEQFSKVLGASRELMVYVWYPADPRGNSKRSRYFPGVDVIPEGKDGEDMRDFWGDSWVLVRADKIVSQTLETPPVASGSAQFPLLTFSPGLGTPVTAYTTLIQEVVSHGYVVVSIEPTYEAPVVVFLDGHTVAALPEATGRHLPTPRGETRDQFIKRMHAFDEPHINRWAADIRFSIDQMTLLNSGKTGAAPFAGRLNLQDIAAWGHSFGGRAAARACQLDRRIKACLNADGLGPDGPIFVFEGESLPSQPLMWMEVYHEPPTEAQLSPYGVTRKEWDKNHQVQLATDEQQLRTCPGGSLHVLVNTSGIGHSSFTDEPFVAATTVPQRKQASVALETIGVYTVAFFDRELKHRGGTVLDRKAPDNAGVTVQVSPPSR